MTVLPFHVRVRDTGEVRPIRVNDRWGSLMCVNGRGWQQAPALALEGFVEVDFLPFPLLAADRAACRCLQHLASVEPVQ